MVQFEVAFSRLGKQENLYEAKDRPSLAGSVAGNCRLRRAKRRGRAVSGCDSILRGRMVLPGRRVADHKRQREGTQRATFGGKRCRLGLEVDQPARGGSDFELYRSAADARRRSFGSHWRLRKLATAAA